MKRCRWAGILTLGIFVLLQGCGGIESPFRDPYTNPVKRVLNNTMPIGFAANLTMAAIQGNEVEGVTFLKGDTSGGGNFLLAIDVDDSYPLPLGTEGTGRILVGGGCSYNKNSLVISILFNELNIAKGKLFLQDISTVVVNSETDYRNNEDVLWVMYCDIDVNSGSDTLVNLDISQDEIEVESKRYADMKKDSLTAENNFFMIKVVNNDTPDDFSDDRYMVSGSGDYTKVNSSDEVRDLRIIMGEIEMRSSCKSNPYGGWVVIQEVDVHASEAELGYILLTGHSSCNGTMKVKAATGAYAGSWDPIQLNLDK